MSGKATKKTKSVKEPNSPEDAADPSAQLPPEAADLERRKKELEDAFPNWRGNSRTLVTMTSEFGKLLAASKETMTSTSAGKKAFNRHARYLRGLKGDLEGIIIKDAAATLISEATVVIEEAKDLYRTGKKKEALAIMKGDRLGNKIAPLAVNKFAELDEVEALQKKIKKVTSTMAAGKKLPKKKVDPVPDKSEEQEKAATKIQSVYRGKAARNDVKQKRAEKEQEKEAAKKKEEEEEEARLLKEGLEQEKAATKIQSVYRGKAARNDVKQKRAEKEQEKEAAKKKEEEEEEAQLLKEGLEQEKAATKIQSVYRGKAARNDVKQKRAEAKKDAPRKEEEVRKEKEEGQLQSAEEQNKAATKIQSVYRGRRARTDVEQKRAEKEQAKKEAAKKTEDEVRKEKEEKEGQLQSAEEQNKAATKIQSVYRGRRAREEIKATSTPTPAPVPRSPEQPPPSASPLSPAKSAQQPALSKRERERQERIAKMQKNLASLENEAKMRKRLAQLQEEERREAEEKEKKKKTEEEEQPLPSEDPSWRRYAVKHREANGRPSDGTTPDTLALESEVLQLRHALHGRDMEIANLRRSLAIPTHQVSEMRKALVKLNSEVQYLRGKQEGPAGPRPAQNPFRRGEDGRPVDLAPGSPLAAAWESYYEKKSERTRDRHGHASHLDGDHELDQGTREDMHVPDDLARTLSYKYAPLANPIPDPIHSLPTPRHIRELAREAVDYERYRQGREARNAARRHRPSALDDFEDIIAENENHANTVIFDLDASLRTSEQMNPINRATPRRRFDYEPFTPSAVDSLARVTLGSSQRILHNKRQVRQQFPSPQQQRANARRARTAAAQRADKYTREQSLPSINQGGGGGGGGGRARTAVPRTGQDPWTPQAHALVRKSQSRRKGTRSAPRDPLRGPPSLLAKDKLDPRSWSKEEVELWLMRIQEQHEMYEFDITALWVNGRTLCQLTEAQLKEVAPGLDGSIIYNELRELLEAQLEREAYAGDHYESGGDIDSDDDIDTSAVTPRRLSQDVGFGSR